jgi:hypothetical protein
LIARMALEGEQQPLLDMQRRTDLVLEDVERRSLDFGQITSDNQGRLRHCPYGHVCPLLVLRKSIVADKLVTRQSMITSSPFQSQNIPTYPNR